MDCFEQKILKKLLKITGILPSFDRDRDRSFPTVSGRSPRPFLIVVCVGRVTVNNHERSKTARDD